MRGFLYRFLLTTLLLFIGFSFRTLAQTSDFGLWSDVEVNKKLNKKMDFSFDVEFRLRNDLKTSDKFQTTLEFDYKILKYLTTGVSYTLINYYHPGNDNHNYQNYWETRHRASLFVEGDYNLGRFNFSLRERLQATYRVLDSVSSADVNPKFVLRSKLSITYNIPKIPVEPFAFCELFNPINGDGNYKIEEYRFGAGLKYKISKQLAVKVGYVYSNGLDVEDSEKVHAATIGLSYKL